MGAPLCPTIIIFSCCLWPAVHKLWVSWSSRSHLKQIPKPFLLGGSWYTGTVSCYWQTNQRLLCPRMLFIKNVWLLVSAFVSCPLTLLCSEDEGPRALLGQGGSLRSWMCHSFLVPEAPSICLEMCVVSSTKLPHSLVHPKAFIMWGWSSFCLLCVSAALLPGTDGLCNSRII